MRGFDHDLVEEHEESADWALWILLGTGAIAALGLWASRKDREVPRWAGTAAMVGLILSTSVIARTAWLGGEIRHPEATGTALGAARCLEVGHARFGLGAGERHGDSD